MRALSRQNAWAVVVSFPVLPPTDVNCCVHSTARRKRTLTQPGEKIQRTSHGWGREVKCTGKCKGPGCVLHTSSLQLSRTSEEGDLSAFLCPAHTQTHMQPQHSPVPATPFSPPAPLQGLYFPVIVCVIPQCSQPANPFSHFMSCPTPICLLLIQCLLFTHLWAATKGRSLKGQGLFPHGSLLVLCGHAGPCG